MEKDQHGESVKLRTDSNPSSRDLGNVEAKLLTELALGSQPLIQRNKDP